MTPLYGFGMAQEDERTEAAALGIGESSGGRLLSIGSGGEVPLSLLALGAASVTAVDVDPHQLHLVRLKLVAATRLEREAAIAFLGYLPARPHDRRRWYRELCEALPEAGRRFWDAAPAAIEHGVVWAGRYERYVRLLVRLGGVVLSRRHFERLVACRTITEQRAVFDAAFNRPLLRAVFRLAFHPKVYGRRGIDARALAHRDPTRSLGDQFFRHLEALCTATLAADNYLLQTHVLGRVISADAVPAYLTRAGNARLRRVADGLELVDSDLLQYLRRSPPCRFDRAHLSNLTDWLPAPAFAEVLALLADRLAPPARLVWRFLHVDRPVPEALAARVVVDRARGEELRARDRFPFYGIVPATVRGTATS